jgi:hypothetical protein
MQRILSYLRAWWRRDDAAGATPAADPPPEPRFTIIPPIDPTYETQFFTRTAANATYWQYREILKPLATSIPHTDSFTTILYTDFSCWTAPQTGKERDS